MNTFWQQIPLRNIITFISIMAAYLVMTLIFLRNMLRKELLHYKNTINLLHSEKNRSEQKQTQLKNRLQVLSSRIREIQSAQAPFDLQSRGISEAEYRVLRILCLYRASNRYIANKLGIAESTVKIHISHILDKLGVEDRYAAIDLCRYNFQDDGDI